MNLLVVVVVSVLGPILTLNSSYHTMIYEITLDYQIAVGYQINVAVGIFPKINKRSLLNNYSLWKFQEINKQNLF